MMYKSILFFFEKISGVYGTFCSYFVIGPSKTFLCNGKTKILSLRVNFSISLIVNQCFLEASYHFSKCKVPFNLLINFLVFLDVVIFYL